MQISVFLVNLKVFLRLGNDASTHRLFDDFYSCADSGCKSQETASKALKSGTEIFAIPLRNTNIVLTPSSIAVNLSKDFNSFISIVEIRSDAVNRTNKPNFQQKKA